jgi:hypothetical protein
MSSAGMFSYFLFSLVVSSIHSCCVCNSKVVLNEQERKAMAMVQQAHAVLNEKTQIRKESNARRLQASMKKHAKVNEARESAMRDQKKRRFAAIGMKDKRRKLNTGGSEGGRNQDD